MKNQIIEQANQDINSSIVSIDNSLIKKTVFDKSKIFFFFTKRDFIDIRNFEENVYFILGYQSINYQHWSININTKNRLERYEHDNKVGVDAILEGFQKMYVKLLQKTIVPDLLSESDLHNFFGNIPDSKGRLDILKESLNRHKLIKVYKIIEEDASNNLIDVSTAYKIAEIMPKSFKDPYLKKIQLSLYSISELMKIKHPRLKTNFTVAIEYQLPKVLACLGILKYSKELTDYINRAKLIDVDSPEEKAIRASSLLACERICAVNNFEAPYLDILLWEQRKNFGSARFHLSKTNRY